VTEVLKMLPEAAGRGQHFQARGHSFSLFGPTLSRKITCLSLFCYGKLAYKWVCLRNFVIELAYAPSTNHSYLKKFKRANERIYFKLFMLVAFSSPVKFSKSAFRCKVCSCTTKTISVSRCESLEIKLFYRRLNSR